MKCFIRTISSSILLLLVAAGQEANESVMEISEDRAQALKQVIEPLADSKRQLQQLRNKLENTEAEDVRKSIQSQIDDEQARLSKFRENFLSTIGGAQAAEYEGPTSEDQSLSGIWADLLEPVARWARDISSSPRELDALRERLVKWQRRYQACESILQNIEELEGKLKKQTFEEEFELARRFWAGRKAESRSQIGVLKSQITEREAQQRPALETLSDSVSAFFRSRGLNLLMALITGVIVFVLSRRIYHGFRQVSPLHRRKISLASRLMDVAAGLIAVLLTLWSIMLVFYVRGDWLLLTLVVLFLIGAVWAGKTSLPPYFEQVRTLLNLGSIREGERVIYEGLPFRVKSLGFLTVLDNPRLQGGEYRIPVRHVMGMISRMPDDKEPWFPTEVDNWVVMADETYGKIITQTPEQVVILRLGGSMKTYAAPDFLANTPENLSHGYRIACTFGVDYQHQEISTTEIPKILEKAITLALHEKFEKEDIKSIKVEFKEAGASSLDMQINTDVSGKLGSRYHVISRFVPRVCVDVCNEQGWVIPFTQITVHQADPS